MTRITPNFLRVAIRVGIAVICVSVLGYFLQGFQEGKWWSSGYIESLSIPLAIAPVAVWFMFVPKLLEFSEREITISTLLGEYTYQWDDLYAYGPGRGVYKIQFSGDRQPYQIFAGAYPASEWAKLINFMKQRFPDRIASGFSIGPGMTPKGDR